MRSVTKWIGVTIGLTALWMVTRAVVFYFVGVIAVFATAFQATVHALTRIGAELDQSEAGTGTRELRVQRDVRIADGLIDLTTAETAQKSAV